MKSFSFTVRVCLGIVLTAAGLFKIGGPPPAWFSVWLPWPSGIWSLTVSLELILGILLFTGWYFRYLSVVTIAFFVVMGSYALGLFTLGEASCGCFGAIHVNPEYAMVFDWVSAFLLAISRKWGIQHDASLSRQWNFGFDPRGFIYLTLCSGICIALLLSPLTRLFKSEVVSLGKESTWVGSVRPGQSRPIRLEIRNNSRATAVKIIGIEAPSTIKLWEDLPIVVPPNQSRILSGTFRASQGGSGTAVMPYRLITNCPTQPEIFGQFSARIISDSERSRQ